MARGTRAPGAAGSGFLRGHRPHLLVVPVVPVVLSLIEREREPVYPRGGVTYGPRGRVRPPDGVTRAVERLSR